MILARLHRGWLQKQHAPSSKVASLGADAGAFMCFTSLSIQRLEGI